MSRHARSSRSSGNLIGRWISRLLGIQRHHHRKHRPEQIGMWKTREEAVGSIHPEMRAPAKKYRHKPSGHRKQGQTVLGRAIDIMLWRVESLFGSGSNTGMHHRKKHRRHTAEKPVSFPITGVPQVNNQAGAILSENAPGAVTGKIPVKKKKRRKPKGNHRPRGRFNIWRYLPYEWMAGWENFLFSLYLRPIPHDPFLKREIDKEKRPVSIKLAHELSFFLSSFVVFIAAGLSAWFIYQLSVVLAAAFFDIDSVLFYYEVMFPVGNASLLWTPLNIIVITLSGPTISLVAGLFTYFYLIRKKEVKGLNRLFFLWLSFHLFNQFFGGFVAGIITNQGFGYVANWLYMGMVLKIFFSLVALSILSFAGYRVVPWLLATAGKPERIRRENRVLFIITQVVLPWLAGSLVLIALRVPNRLPQHNNILIYDAIIAGTIGVMALAMFFNRFAKPAPVVFRNTNYRTGFIWFFSTLIVVLLVRLVLSYGLHIVIHFSMHVGFFNS